MEDAKRMIVMLLAMFCVCDDLLSSSCNLEGFGVPRQSNYAGQRVYIIEELFKHKKVNPSNIISVLGTP